MPMYGGHSTSTRCVLTYARPLGTVGPSHRRVSKRHMDLTVVPFPPASLRIHLAFFELKVPYEDKFRHNEATDKDSRV
jgi:hypothetical protein